MTDTPLRPGQIYARLRQVAAERARPFNEILTLYVLERFLARLTKTEYAQDFVLKGGVLLAAFRLRRPTRDVDLQALDFTLDEQHMKAVVAAVAAVDAADGVRFDSAAVVVEPIRDEDDYQGLRVHVPAHVASFAMSFKLDVSTGDPITPEPQMVEIPALLGGVIAVRGHPIQTVIAEKTVTILQRGTASTRWRDLHDIRALSLQHPFRAGDLRDAAEAVAAHRGVELASLADVVAGWSAVGQLKWAGWVRRLPGSPWMPRPTPIFPVGTVNSGRSAPGSVQPLNATPSVRVLALASRVTRSTAPRSYPWSAAAPAILKTTKSPAMPRRLWISSRGALAMSSVTKTTRVSVPSALSRCCAWVKFMTSPA